MFLFSTVLHPLISIQGKKLIPFVRICFLPFFMWIHAEFTENTESFTRYIIHKIEIMFVKICALLTFFSVFLSAKIPVTTPNNSKINPSPPLSILTRNGSKTVADSCIDLAFDTIKIIKMTDKYIEIEFSIVNKGNFSAPIFGSRFSKEDNVAVHFYFSGTNRMTRGAIFVDGIYLTQGLKETKGWLTPNEVYTERIKLSLKKRISFYGVILLQLDAFDILRQECDETNNVKAITPRWY